ENHLGLSDAEKEFQAEMVAYSTASYFGIDTSDYSLGYLASWTKGKELGDKEKLLREVKDTSVEFIERIEKDLVFEKELEDELVINAVLYSNENKIVKHVYGNVIDEEEVIQFDDKEEMLEYIKDMNFDDLVRLDEYDLDDLMERDYKLSEELGLGEGKSVVE